jgi:hypothetical protein
MQEFVGILFNSTSKEIKGLVEAAREVRQPMYTVINGVGLIADPHTQDPDYIDQLIWTFEVVFEPDDRAVIGQREFYQNIVPELQALRGRLLAELDGLEDDDRAIEFLLRLAPVTWCKWAWNRRDSRAVLSRLGSGRHRLIELGRNALLHPHAYSLNHAWIAQAHSWLGREGRS